MDPTPSYQAVLLTALGEALDHAFADEHSDAAHQLTAVDVVAERVQNIRDVLLLDLVAAGHTHADIAKGLGRSKSAVTQQVHAARNREQRRREDREASLRRKLR
jgi:DNA-binding NarL/FixJ family response regulator